MADFQGFSGSPRLSIFGHIPAGNASGESEVYVLERSHAGPIRLFLARPRFFAKRRGRAAFSDWVVLPQCLTVVEDVHQHQFAGAIKVGLPQQCCPLARQGRFRERQRVAMAVSVVSNGVQKGPPIGVEEGPPFRII
ncbi:hypothetical protein [Sphingopyxis sp. SCN 67-31]|uniref:hypothetical protein n=1 Tax=Sphingopyxis sp. SCN 67-31 TaxID=1660142 RepID=UPI00086CD566|nr:hypothetical protein [Sphingopyxis sp. SCN 67-31]ODU29287.1 MAG: hypothetical protein ABS88_10135 [Sphingopyxis sp. SCN 67-31]